MNEEIKKSLNEFMKGNYKDEEVEEMTVWLDGVIQDSEEDQQNER